MGTTEAKELDCPVAVVTDGCEPPDMAAENGTQGLCKKSTYLTTDSSPPPRYLRMTRRLPVFKVIFMTN